MNKYLSVLTSLQLIERRISITEKNKRKSRKGLYFIKNSFFKFWFKFIFENQEYVEQERQDKLIEEKITPELNSFAGRVFEDVVLSEILKNKDYQRYIFGRWWDNELEADIVGIDKEKKKILIGEVKFSNLSKKDIAGIEKSLKEKSKRINSFGFKEGFIIICLEHEDYKTETKIINFKDLL